MKVVVRVDGTAQIGLGHVMRCLTLANQFLPFARVTFLSCPLPFALHQQAEQAGITLLTAPPLNSSEQSTRSDCKLDEQAQYKHANQCIDVLSRAHNDSIDILIIDHYQLSSAFSKTMRRCSKHIVVIDDLANRQHDCDVLLDQNLYDNYEVRYEQLVPSHCLKLLGPKFAILRDEFYSSSVIPRKDNHFLICFGGSDPSNLTERVVDTLLSLKSLTISADIVVGAGYTHTDSLKTKVSSLANVTLHVACSYIAQLMKTASTMIGAGGSMHWERAASGVAGMIITLADNQIETTRCLHKQQCCLWIGKSDDVTQEDISEAINFAISSPEKMRKLADNAASLLNSNKNPSFVVDTILNSIKR